MESFVVINSIQEMGNFQTDLLQTKNICFDIETTGLDTFVDKITLIQLRMNNNIYIINATTLGKSYIIYLLSLVEASGKQILGHNVGFDLKFIKFNYNISFVNVADTMLAERLLRNGLDNTQFYSLQYLVSKYCGVLLNKELREEFFNNTNITQEKLIYAADDVRYLNDVYEAQYNVLNEQSQLRVLYLENKIIPIIVSMELSGVQVNKVKWEETTRTSKEKLKLLHDDLVNKIIDDALSELKYSTALELVDELELGIKKVGERKMLSGISDVTFIKEYLKSTINLNSHKQMLAILIKVYKIKTLKNTNEKTINKLTDKYPIINEIIAYREVEKEVSGFDTGYLDKIHAVTGNLHTNYHQCGAVTGRFSSSDPNMQNIKGADDDGISKYRPCIEAHAGNVLISGDYSQQELRILAEITRDPKMLDTFNKDLDPHKVTAVGLFDNITYDTITKEQRQTGKRLNFAINYGTTEYGLQRNFDIPIEKGKDYIEKYFKYYNVYSQYVEAVNNKIWELGYTTTMLGRKRFFEKKVLFENGYQSMTYKDKLLRSLRNHIIQGTGADITKTALVNIFYNNPFGDKLKIVLQVHDEIVVECSADIKDEARDFVEEQMLLAEKDFLKVVSSKVDVKYSDHWEH